VFQSFSRSLSNGNYSWNVRCYDNSSYRNVGYSDVYNFTVSKATSIVVKVAGDRLKFERGERALFITNTSDAFKNPIAANLTLDIINRTAVLPWWNSSFKYRQAINITPGNPLVANSTINYSLSTLSLISQGKMRSDGLDLRIAWFDNSTNTWRESNRLVLNINSAGTNVIFKTRRNISALDRSYYVYYGNASVSSAPQNKSDVYYFYDSFGTNTLSSYGYNRSFTDSAEDTNNIFNYNVSRLWVNVVSNTSKGKSLRRTIPSIKDVVVEVDQYVHDTRGVYAKLELAARINGLSYYSFFASTNILDSALYRYDSIGAPTLLASSSTQFQKKDVWRHLKFVAFTNQSTVVLQAFVNSTQLFNFIDSSAQRLDSVGSFGVGEYQLIGRFDNITLQRYLSQKPVLVGNAQEKLIQRSLNATGLNGKNNFRWATGNQPYGNYTLVSSARKKQYYDGYNYFKFQLVRDTTAPNVTLLSPILGLNTTNTTLKFQWSAVDRADSNVTCNLTLNKLHKATVSTIGTANYSTSTVEGFNYWNVTCIDHANNTNTSRTRFFVVVFPPKNLSISLSGDNRSIRLNWSIVSYADFYEVFIAKNYTYFYSTPNVTLTKLNWTDQKFASPVFYRVSARRSNVRALYPDTVGRHLFSLYPAWNMVSLPLSISLHRLKNATLNGYDPFVSPKGCVIQIWRYNATRPALWEETVHENGHWAPATGSGNFTTMEDLVGYWFYNNRSQACNFTVLGVLPKVNYSVRLNNDYNLVAWHSEDSPLLPSNCQSPYPLLAAPPNSIRYAYYYDSSLNQFKGAMHFEYSGCNNNDWGWWPSSPPRNLLGFAPTRSYYLRTSQKSNWTMQVNK